MSEEQKTRNYRSREERIAELEKKIAYHKGCIKTLEQKKSTIEKGRRGRTRTKSLKRLITEAKLSDGELLKVMALGGEEAIRAELNRIIEQKTNEG